MMENRIVPNINIFSNINSSMPIDEFSQKGFGVNSLNDGSGSDFKTVLSGLVNKISAESDKPDQLLNRQMMGDSEVDIHDVTTAIAKADLGITLATQITSKVVNAYTAVMNISI